MNLIFLLLDRAASTAMLVCPQRQKMCSMPRASRYFTNWFAIRSFMECSLKFLLAAAIPAACSRSVVALRGHGPPRRPAVAIWNVLRHRTHHPFSALYLFPCVRQDADRA